MIVPSVWYDVWQDLDSIGGRGTTLYGAIGPEVGVEEAKEEAEPRRPIGFRMPEKPVSDPSWMLL